ncbi:hypothetical protein INT47_000928 [Mucor saturninus]|uniref:Uncharacterized protein n=1 Tax=Mucor saturninus TaxID=64648 RepID=A0A8H7VD31_9FUNG|nr:hypothetical protein INT47_000928 [Mucor saturninus]
MDYYNRGEYDKAFLHLKEAASRNYAESQFQLGEMYSTGFFVERDEVEALRWYSTSLNNGFLAARFKIGLIYLSKTGCYIKPNYEKAVSILSDVKGENDNESCHYIATMYTEGGFGIQKDFYRAKMWYQKFKYDPRPNLFGAKWRSQQNLYTLWKDGHDNLGMIFFKGGYGIEKDYQIASSYWSQNSDDKSYAFMGILYALRDDGEQDFIKAMSWFRLTKRSVWTVYDVSIGIFYEKGLGIEKNYSEAIVYYNNACEGKVAQGFVSMGLLYQKGLGVPQDFTKSHELYETALKIDENNGAHGDAMACLGILYQYGLGVTTSHSKAIGYFQKAVDSGSLYGYNCMGDAYKYGCGVDIDYGKAFQWYLKCDDCYDNTVHFWEQGFRPTLRFCDEGWLNIGIMYLNGLGTNVNKKLALVYLGKALKFGNTTAQFYIDHIHNVPAWPYQCP